MRFLAFLGGLAILVVVGAAVFFFGGFYDVAARDKDPAAVAWALGRIRDAAVTRSAENLRVPQDFEDSAQAVAGARAFAARGCVNCHGAPGVKWAKFSEGLNPDPPDLKESAGELTARQIFWTVRNGLRMTAMPSFGAIGASDQEIWSIAAFVKHLPTVTEENYRQWTAPPPPVVAPPDASPAAPAPPKP